MKKTKELPRFVEFPNNDSYVTGEYKTYRFSAKLFDNCSEFGIKNGRVSKLTIINENIKDVVHYDRGWDVKPSKEFRKDFNIILKFLENSPKRFEN